MRISSVDQKGLFEQMKFQKKIRSTTGKREKDEGKKKEKEYRGIEDRLQRNK